MGKSVAIIGGGLGGLFTGCILAKEGCKVTLIEKNPTLGGGLQSFRRFGEIFDTGMHVIGGMREGGNIRRICDYLGITSQLRINHIGPHMIDSLYFSQDKCTYKIAMGRENFVAGLAEHFPQQKENLENFMDAVFAIVDKMDIYHLRPTTDFFQLPDEEFIMPADQFIAKYIDDERLRGVLAYMNPMYSGRAGQTPAYIHAIITHLYVQGPSRFIGGSQHMADIMGEYIENHGGTVIKADGVARINTDVNERTITSLTTVKGRTVSADVYVSAIHPCTLIGLLDDPKALPKAYRTRLESIPNAYSAFTLNIKLKKDVFPYLNYTGYYMSRYDELWNFGREDRNWPLGFLYMTPPEEEQGEWARKIIITAPMTWSHVKQWEDSTLGHRPKEYEEWKQACASKLLDNMEEMYPGFHEMVEDINTASPLTIRDWYGVKEGSMCGFSKDSNNITLSQLPVITKISNLLLTGQNNSLHGYCGVPLTAINTAEAILGRNYVLNKINAL